MFLAALVFALVGPKGFAFPCFGFGIAALIIAIIFLPAFARA
jgi:hypothetical protein